MACRPSAIVENRKLVVDEERGQAVKCEQVAGAIVGNGERVPVLLKVRKFLSSVTCSQRSFPLIAVFLLMGPLLERLLDTALSDGGGSI